MLYRIMVITYLKCTRCFLIRSLYVFINVKPLSCNISFAKGPITFSVTADHFATEATNNLQPQRF